MELALGALAAADAKVVGAFGVLLTEMGCEVWRPFCGWSVQDCRDCRYLVQWVMWAILLALTRALLPLAAQISSSMGASLI